MHSVGYLSIEKGQKSLTIIEGAIKRIIAVGYVTTEGNEILRSYLNNC